MPQGDEVPGPSQAHQIRGLDYDALFAVLQWLVRKVMATREERAELIRRYSKGVFEREGYETVTDKDRATKEPAALAQVGKVDRDIKKIRDKIQP
jgi:hypothetical protein